MNNPIPIAIPIANPSDHDWSDALWLLSFGAYGGTRVFVWTNGADCGSAFEIAIDYLDDQKIVGFFVSISPGDLADAARDLGAEWPTEDEETLARVWETAEADLTSIGHTTLQNAGPGPHYVPSWEWSLDECAPDVVEAVRRRSIAECEGAA